MATPHAAIAQSGSSDAMASKHPARLVELERVERCDGTVEGRLGVFGAGRFEPDISHDGSRLRGCARRGNLGGIRA